MAETLTAAMPTIPTYPLQEDIKVVVISAAGATWFMEAQKIVTIEYMLLFCPRKPKDLMNIYNR